MNDLNIIGALACDKDGLKNVNIEIRDGKIFKLTPMGQPPAEAKKTLNAKGLTLIPAMIDTHTHIRGGDFSYREDFKSGSMAALSGGVCEYFEMPGGSLPVSTPSAFAKRFSVMKENSLVDFKMYAGAGYDNLDEISALAKCNPVGFKTFMNPPIKGREAEFYGLCAYDNDALLEVMKRVKKTGLTLTVHAEDYSIINKKTAELISQGRGGVQSYFNSRPEESEISAVKTALDCAKISGCPLNIAHVSTSKAAKMIIDARKSGVDVMGEITLHYLFYNQQMMRNFGSFARMKPPFRCENTRRELLNTVKESDIFYIGSDHAPFTYEEKHPESTIWQAADGLAGIEMSLPLLLELVYKKELTLTKACELSSFNAAKRFGIKNKGLIKEGNAADFVLFKTNDKGFDFKKENMKTKAFHSGVIYENTRFHTKITLVIKDGRENYF